jgi:UDP-2,3-diacylglucosamine pyrophosphatase LpxH
MEAIRPEDKIHCRTIWISDVHLGSVHSKTQQLLQLLERVQCERLYLVGDIVDLLAMRRRGALARFTQQSITEADEAVAPKGGCYLRAW